MAILYVKKDGTGNSTTIQGAMPLAQSGDEIVVEAGTFEENIDFYKNGITITGAGKDQTIIAGQQQTSLAKAGCTWTLGSTTINVPAGTSGLKAGHIVSASGIPTNTRIVTVSATSFTISAATTAARTNVSVTMALIDAAVRWRGDLNKLQNVKVKGVQALETRAATDSGSIYFRSAALGSTAATNYWVENCDIEAMGDSAIMCDNTGVGGGTVKNCFIYGKTFVGASPAQVHAFSSLPLQCNILTLSTIELPSSEYLVDVKVGSPILAVTGLVQASTTISAINGNVLTLNKPLLSGVGTTQTITFTNIQFNIPNVARQLVVFQPNNTSPVTFINNNVSGVTGGGISYNQAVTCDVVGSTISGNTFDGEFGTQSYALRVRGLNSTVTNNVNITTTYPNLGYYILPNHAVNVLVTVGTMILNSSKYWVCIQEHTSSATNAPTGVDGTLYWSEITLEQVNASGSYGVGLQEIGNNTVVNEVVITFNQANSGDPVLISISKELIKSNSLISSDPVFSDELNWHLVGVVYKKDSKRMTSGFRDTFDSENEMKLKSGLPGETFTLHKIIISKADRTLKVIPRANITNPSSFDITLK